MGVLPFIEEHRVVVDASAERTRSVVSMLAHRLAGRPAPRAFVSLWGLEPSSGFAITSSSPDRIVLSGRHRFARYELAFELRPTEGRVEVCSQTSAEFPGVAGRLYRALVIGTGGHGIVVRSMLRRLRRAAERAS